MNGKIIGQYRRSGGTVQADTKAYLSMPFIIQKIPDAKSRLCGTWLFDGTKPTRDRNSPLFTFHYSLIDASLVKWI